MIALVLPTVAFLTGVALALLMFQTVTGRRLF